MKVLSRLRQLIKINQIFCQICFTIVISVILIILLIINLNKSEGITTIKNSVNNLQLEIDSYDKVITQNKISIYLINDLISIKKHNIEMNSKYIENTKRAITQTQFLIFEKRNRTKDDREKIEKHHDRLSIAIYHNEQFQTQKDHLNEQNLKLKKELKELNNNNNNNYKSTDDLYLESSILSKEYIQLINSWINEKLLFKCYDMKRDGLIPTVFHRNCGDLTPTIVFIKTQVGEDIGGYTRQTWGGNIKKHDKHAFIFSLSKKRKFQIITDYYAINTNSQEFMQFGRDLVIEKDGKGYSLFPSNYGERNDYFVSFLNNSEFVIKEMEVYQTAKLIKPY